MPSVAEILRGRTQAGFSIEVLPPLKGKGTEKLMDDIEKMMRFSPLFVNITIHHSEPVFEQLEGGMLRKKFVRKRPGTVAVAAAIHHRFGIPTVPHIICQGFTPEETEYSLIDLNFLGIHDLFLLRGDNDKETVVPKEMSHAHATDLIAQVSDFNRGCLIDGVKVDPPSVPFSFGVAGYPEKHAEAPNMQSDIDWLKRKVDMGAEYVITQLFFDNERFYRFRDSAAAAGVSVPIVPGLKPLSRRAQLSILPSVFGTEIPDAFVRAVNAAKDEDIKSLGRDHLLAQADDLVRHGVPCVHFYTLGAVDTVCSVAAELFK